MPRMRALAAFTAVSLLIATQARPARAGDFDALAKASWTYEVVAGAKHEPSGAKVAFTVASVHAVGPYTVVELGAAPEQRTGDPEIPTLIIGPDGVHAAPFFSGGDLPPDQRYALD